MPARPEPLRNAARAAAWVSLAAVVIGPPLWGEGQFFYRDVHRQYEPVLHQVVSAFRHGALPFWNPSTQGGVPLLANPHAGALSPHTALFHALPFDLAYAWTCALALAALGLGTFQLLRRRATAGASLAGALTAMLSGVALSATSYVPMLVGLACVPFIARLAAEPGPRRLSLRLAALLALQVLAGDPSTVVMGVVVALALLRPPRLVPLVRLGASGLLGAGLAAAQLVPAWALLGDSARGSASIDQRLAWSFHPARTLEWVLRLPFGRLLEPPFFERYELAAGHDGQPFLLDHGWGVLAALLLWPALTRPGPLRRAGLLLVGTGFLLSVGKHVPVLALLHELPPFSFFRFPERFGGVVLFGAAFLAANGAAALAEAGARANRWALGWVGVGAALLVGSAVADGALASSLVRAGAFFAVAGLGARFIARTPTMRLVLLLLLGAVDWADARSADRLVLPASPARPPPLVDLVRESGARVWRDNAGLRVNERPARGVAGFAEARHLDDATFASALPGLSGIDELGGYSPVALRWWQQVVREYAGAPDVLFRMFGVCFVVSTPARRWNTRFPFEELGALSNTARLYRYPGCLPRAWTTTRVQGVEDLELALAQLGRPGFDPAVTAVVEGLEGTPPVGAIEARLLPRNDAGRLDVELAGSTSPGFLVVAESWAPGWQATHDGQPTEVYRVNGTLLGVTVPPGVTRVTFTYEEPGWALGLALSAASALAALLVTQVRRRRPVTAPS